jgi:hypothetical protein
MSMVGIQAENQKCWLEKQCRAADAICLCQRQQREARGPMSAQISNATGGKFKGGLDND